MPESSAHAVTFDEIEAHARALVRLMPKGPPEWASNDLTFGQLRLLFVLGQSGPVSIGQLAQMLGVADATASEFVDRVERRGFAVRSHRPDDRRVVECRLSDNGALLLSEVAGVRRDALRTVLSVLTPEELGRFDQLIQIMAERWPATRGASIPATSNSTEGGPLVNFATPPTSPADASGRGPG